MLDRYARETRQRGEDHQTHAADLLADLMHLAEARGWAWETIHEKAEGHYLAETMGECPEADIIARRGA